MCLVHTDINRRYGFQKGMPAPTEVRRGKTIKVTDFDSQRRNNSHVGESRTARPMPQGIRVVHDTGSRYCPN
jgi:hypothetical protein